MSNPAVPDGKPVEFEMVVPILRVKNLSESLQYYQEILGFKKDWGGSTPKDIMASVSRNKCPVMLCQGEQGNPGTWVWFGVGNAETLYREYQAKGVKIILPPTNYSWAMEIRVQDPDGHVLRFGSEPRTDIPFVTP